MSNFVTVRVTLRGPNPPWNYKVDIDRDTDFQAMKDDILHTLGTDKGVALDSARYKLTVRGTLLEPHLFLDRV